MKGGMGDKDEIVGLTRQLALEVTFFEVSGKACKWVLILELTSWGKMAGECMLGWQGPSYCSWQLRRVQMSAGRWDKYHLPFSFTFHLTGKRHVSQLKFKWICTHFQGLSSLKLLPENQNLVRIILGTDSKCERLKYCQHGNLHNIIAGENKLSTTYSNALWAESILEHTKIISTIYQQYKAQDYKN